MAKKTTPSPAKKTPAKPSAASRNEASAARGWLPYALVVLAITAACYLPSLSNGFVNWDDDPNITENPNLEMVGKGQPWGTTIANIFDIDKGNVIGNYNPLPILTFAIEKSVSGGEFDEGYAKLVHFNNLVLHLLTVFLVIKLLLAMGFGNWGAFVGGLLFGIHPMRVESVAWATERKDVLFAVFFFAALVYYMKWLRQKDRGESGMNTYLIMVVLALLSCFSKVQAVTLPLSMLVLDYWHRRQLTFALILEKIPFWLMSLAFGLANLYTLKQQGSTTDELTNFNILDRLCIGAYSVCVYLYKLAIPYPMSPLYPYPKPLPVWVYLAPIGFIALCYGVWRAWKSDNRVVVAGSLFFFFNIMFLLQVLGAGQGFLADRFTYVPYFGFFAILAWYYNTLVQDDKWKSTLPVVLGVFGLAYAVWTVRQIGIWKNGETLWSHVMKFEKKTNSLPYWNRGQYYRSMGNFDGALRDYTQAVDIEPQNPELLNSRGKTYFDMAMSGKFRAKEAEFVQKALADYSAALSKPTIKPKSKAEILINRGAAEGSRGNNQQAITDISEGLKIDPTNKNGYFNRSIAYFSVKQYENALSDYREYLKYDPNNANVWYESGMIQRSLNRNEEALQSLDQAIRLSPNFAVAYIERARAKAQSGNKSGAQGDYQKAQQLGAKLDGFDQQLMRGDAAPAGGAPSGQ
jgi:protein O-mannosyl-transferase